MKIKVLFVILCAVFISLLFYSCSDDKDSKFIGSWLYISAWPDNPISTWRWDFYKDGTCTKTILSASHGTKFVEEGEYYIEKEILYYTYNGDTTEYNYELGDGYIDIGGYRFEPTD